MPRKSKVWEHFTRSTDKNGGQATCNSCSKVFKAKGTSSMWRHFKKFHNQEGSAPSGSGASKDREPAEGLEATRDLARMIALHGYDPSVVEDDYFRSFVRHLNPGFELPSCEAIEKMCSSIFQGYMGELYFRSIDSVPGKVSLAVGQSRTIETGQVVHITTHFIDHNWNLNRVVEDVRLALPVGDHYHVPLRPVDMVPLDGMVDDIVSDIEYGVIIDQNELFMIAGETTGHINHLKLKDRIQEERLVENIIYSATYMDHVLHSVARCLLPDSEFAERTFNAIKLSQYDLLEEHKDLLTKLGLLVLDDRWGYDERWYLCYCSLEILHQTLPFGSDDTTEQLLLALWRVIYGAIKRVSDSSRPTSNLCLQELFNVRDVLLSQLSKHQSVNVRVVLLSQLSIASPAAYSGNYSDFGDKHVADVLGEALETVDKAIQDSYLVWSIPLVLDPRYKLRYIQFIFERAFGSDSAEYVSEVRRKTKELYTSYYIEHRDDFEDNHEDSDGSIEEMSIDNDSTTPLMQQWDEICRLQDDSHAEAETELDHYLQDRLAPKTEGFDILDWWKVHGSVQYPMVARMARDALAMPTCSKLSSDQVAQVRSILRGYAIFNLERSDSFSGIKPASGGVSFAVDKAKTIKEEVKVKESSQFYNEKVEHPSFLKKESSQGPAVSQSEVTYESISSFHDKNIRTGTGHGTTTMGPPSRLQGNRNEWVLDTSAWIHYTFNLRLLRDLTMRNLEEVADTLPPEGEVCLPVLGRGSVDTENFAVPDVSYIQGESRNVISVAQLARSHGLLTVFEPTRCYVMDKMSQKIIGEGHLRDGTYVLHRLLISQLDGGGQNGSKDKEGKQGGCGGSGSGGGLFGGGSGDGGGGQGRGGQAGGKEGGDQAGGGADGGNGGGGEKDKEKEGRYEKYKKDDEEEEDDDEEMKEEKNEEEEKEKKGVEKEHQQLSRAPRGLVGPFQSAGTVPTGGVFVTPTQRNSDFIMDSGAGHHVTYFTLNQDSFRAYPGNLNITPAIRSIVGVDGVCLDVAGIGYLEGQSDALDYVLYVPHSVANMVSVRQLVWDYKVRVLFDARMFSIERLANREQVGSGIEKGNVYVLERFRAGRLVPT